MVFNGINWYSVRFTGILSKPFTDFFQVNIGGAGGADKIQHS